jgi:hypothetical protein
MASGYPNLKVQRSFRCSLPFAQASGVEAAPTQVKKTKNAASEDERTPGDEGTSGYEGTPWDGGAMPDIPGATKWREDLNRKDVRHGRFSAKERETIRESIKVGWAQ